MQFIHTHTPDTEYIIERQQIFSGRDDVSHHCYLFFPTRILCTTSHIAPSCLTWLVLRPKVTLRGTSAAASTHTDWIIWEASPKFVDDRNQMPE